MKIEEVINKLNNSKSKGFQIEKRYGILTSTWLIFKVDRFYYYFDINQKIEFLKEYRYSKEEILLELKDSNFEIDFSIN